MQKWALERVNEFEYRSCFKLTHQEYLKEPYDVFIASGAIMRIKAQIREEERKRERSKLKVKK